MSFNKKEPGSTQQIAHDISKEFFQAKEQLYHTVNRYFHQPISSNYVKEDDIRLLLDQCEAIKKEYHHCEKELFKKHEDNLKTNKIKFNF